MRHDQIAGSLPSEEIDYERADFGCHAADFFAEEGVRVVGGGDGVGDVGDGGESVDDVVLTCCCLEHVCDFPEFDEAEVGGVGTFEGWMVERS